MESNIKEGSLINGRRVTKILLWRVYYDTMTKKVCGMPCPDSGSAVFLSDEGKKLPLLQNKPTWVEERDAMMVILSEKGEG